MVNFAVTQDEGVTIHTIDHIGAMMACWMRKGSIKPEDCMVAKCWDLSDAYKQVYHSRMRLSTLIRTW